MNKRLLLPLLLPVLLLTSSSALAHHPHDVTSIVRVSPDYAQDRTLFVTIEGTFDLLLRSTDGGSSWAPTHSGMRGRSVNDLAFSPGFATDRTIYVATDRAGVDISTDGGNHWGPTVISQTSVKSIALAPDFITSRILLAASKKGLFRSTDGGATAEIVLDRTHPPAHAILFSADFAHDATIYLAGDSDGLLISRDAGLTWDTVATGFEPLVALDVAIAPNFTEDPTIILATQDNSLLTSHDEGTTWSRYAGGVIPPDTYITAVTMSPDYAADSRAIFTTAGLGVFQSDDAGYAWHPLDLPFIPYTSQTSVHFRGIEFSPNFATDGQLFLALFEGLRIYRPDEADPWFAPRLLHTRLGRRMAISPNFAEDSIIVATGYGFEVLYSSDAGRSWEIRNQGSVSVSNYALALAPDFGHGGPLMSGTGWGLEVSDDEGISWSKHYFKEGNEQGVIDNNALGATKAIQFSPNWENDQTVFAGNWWTVQKSLDGGETWHKVVDLRHKCYDIAISPGFEEDSTLFVAGPQGLLRSTDAGADWETFGEINNASGLRFVELSPLFGEDSVAFAGFVADGVERSLDGGLTWDSRVNRMPDGNITTMSVSRTFAEDHTVAVSTHGAGVVLSEDGGTSWEKRWPDGLEGDFVECLALSPNFAQDSTMIAGCYGGFYMSWDAGFSWTRTSSVERYDDRRQDTALFSPTPWPPALNLEEEQTQLWRLLTDLDWFAIAGEEYAEGAATVGTLPHSKAHFDFVGSGVSWIGARGPSGGLAAWSLDGGTPDTLDLYSPIEEFDLPVLTLTGLAPGLHLLEIEVLGEGEELNWDAQVVIDAFDVFYGESETFHTSPGSRPSKMRQASAD
jgi:photosystem II stability/assembly factor-like uncharacterized protein